MASSRSHEELSLASLFSRTLRNLVALMRAERPRPRVLPRQILEAAPADVQASPALFRLIQLSLLPHVLGDSTGAVLYLAAKRFSRDLGLESIAALKSWFREMGLGEVEVELDEEKVLVKVSRCLTCYRLPAVGASLCDMERGLVDGVLERITGAEVLTKETLCWGLGDTVCQFEGYAGHNGGYVYVENGFHPEAQRRLLSGLAGQSEVALENLQLVLEKRSQEMRDPLTGLYNFRHLREHADLELGRSERHGRHVAFVMLDIDGFADVNAAMGETGGDEFLKQWAAALERELRVGDLVCRYGADEFLVVLPETADRQADSALERILRDLRELTVEVDGRRFSLSACAGVATYPQDGSTAEELVAKATTTMYVAKSRGQGQLAFYSPPESADA